MIKTLEIIQRYLIQIVWEFQTPKHKTDENDVLFIVGYVPFPLTNSQVAQIKMYFWPPQRTYKLLVH